MRHALVLLATAACLTAGCHKKTAEVPATPAAPPATQDSGQPLAAGDSGTRVQGGPAAAREACVDLWLQEHKLDRFGHAEGTMYTGGTPLFNEATGESKDRLEYIFARNPEALKACPATGTP
ncbi:MAG: hypothetical protein ABW123_22410 [Cystobacter sp.]